MKFTPATDEVLRENGFDPGWIMSVEDDEEGPFRVYRNLNGICGQCGGKASEWMVLNIATAAAAAESYAHDDGEVVAQEECNQRNSTWLDGYAAAALSEETEAP